MNNNVAILEDWAGGPKLSQQFREALKAAGYNLTDQLNADVVIAHSSGCFAINPKSPVFYYILIDPPYWPGKSLLSRFLVKKRADNKILKQQLGWKGVLNKTRWEFLYLMTKPGLAFRKINDLNYLSPIQDKRVLIVRNENDYFCSPEIQVALSQYANVGFLSLPGEHDDYYSNPQPYIDLLSK